jgi:GAF domain-containing protein
VLVVESNRHHAFGTDDFEVLRAAAHQAGIAIGRERLLSAERRRADAGGARATIADLCPSRALRSAVAASDAPSSCSRSATANSRSSIGSVKNSRSSRVTTSAARTPPGRA